MYENVIVNAVPRRELDRFLAPAGGPSPAIQAGIVIHDKDELVPDHVEGNILHVSFDDEEEPGWGVPIEPAQAEAVMGFAADGASLARDGSLDSLDIVVSCKGGVSRSAAVAMAIYLMLFGAERAKSRWLLSGNYLPNRHVFETCVAAEPELAGAYDPSEWDTAFADGARARLAKAMG